MNAVSRHPGSDGIHVIVTITLTFSSMNFLSLKRPPVTGRSKRIRWVLAQNLALLLNDTMTVIGFFTSET
jgi:hypothetical protein